MDRWLSPRARVVAAVIGLALSAGGMGGCAGPASIAKADFVAQANATCEQASAGWDALVEKLPTTPVIARERYVVDKLAPALGTVVNQLRSLGYPAGDEAYLESIYADAEKVAAKMIDMPGTDLQPKLDAPFSSPAARFTSYGLVKCAEL